MNFSKPCSKAPESEAAEPTRSAAGGAGTHFDDLPLLPPDERSRASVHCDGQGERTESESFLQNRAEESNREQKRGELLWSGSWLDWCVLKVKLYKCGQFNLQPKPQRAWKPFSRHICRGIRRHVHVHRLESAQLSALLTWRPNVTTSPFGSQGGAGQTAGGGGADVGAEKMLKKKWFL